MMRGEVWWASLPSPIGRRPVLILSRDSMPKGRTEITVVYLTTRVRHTLVEVPLTQTDGLPMTCVVNFDSINTVPKRFLEALICRLSEAKMAEVKSAILEALDLT